MLSICQLDLQVLFDDCPTIAATDLQVCKSCKLQIQVIEGRDNGRRRPEMGSRPGHSFPGAGPRGQGTNFPGLT